MAESARLSESRVLIGYPNGLGFPALFPQEKFFLWPYYKSFIDRNLDGQDGEIYIYIYFFFALLLTTTSTWSMETQKKELDQYLAIVILTSGLVNNLYLLPFILQLD